MPAGLSEFSRARTRRDASRRAPGLGYALGDDPATAPGPALLLTRGEPVEITVVNQLKRSTSVHWHGIELESYYDGVPHWNGDDRRTPWTEPDSRSGLGLPRLADHSAFTPSRRS